MLKNIDNLKMQLRTTLSIKNGPLIVPKERSLSKPKILEVDAQTMEEERKSSTHNIKQTSYKMPAVQQRQTQLMNRGTYHRQTINTLPQEVKIAEIIIAEVKKLVCMLYGTIVRFYIPVVKYDDLHEMREDLIELLTSLTVRGELSKIILNLCRLCTKEDETQLQLKL